MAASGTKSTGKSGIATKRRPGQHGPKKNPLPRACKVCGEDRPGRLVKDRKAPQGLKRMCIECQSSWRRAWVKTKQGQAHAKRIAEEAKRVRAEDPGFREAQVAATKKYRSKRRPFALAIGAAVREWRKANGLTMKVLAQAMGISISCVSARERGITAFTAAERVKLERAGVKFWPDEED
jgi:ribosome-binding protein aMBF1 (putative translation factor)